MDPGGFHNNPLSLAAHNSLFFWTIPSEFTFHAVSCTPCLPGNIHLPLFKTCFLAVYILKVFPKRYLGFIGYSTGLMFGTFRLNGRTARTIIHYLHMKEFNSIVYLYKGTSFGDCQSSGKTISFNKYVFANNTNKLRYSILSSEFYTYRATAITIQLSLKSSDVQLSTNK